MPTLDLATGGLVLIMIAWLIQLYQILKINRNISLYFVIAYLVGVMMLVVSAFLANTPVSYFQLGSFVTAAIVLIAMLRKK